jgi:hypothetical protein
LAPPDEAGVEAVVSAQSASPFQQMAAARTRGRPHDAYCKRQTSARTRVPQPCSGSPTPERLDGLAKALAFAVVGCPRRSSRVGDEMVRTVLYEAANVLLSRVALCL